MRDFIYRTLMRWANCFADEPPHGKFTRRTTAHPHEATEAQKKILKKRRTQK